MKWCVCPRMHTCACLLREALSCSLDWCQLPDPALSLSHTSSCVGTFRAPSPEPEQTPRSYASPRPSLLSWGGPGHRSPWSPSPTTAP